MLDEASMLLGQKQDLEIKRQLLDAFNNHFIVSEDDLLTLTNVAEPIDDRFFLVLKKVKQIHSDCKILLGSENQRLGLELMDQRSRNLNSAYQKLYLWIQRECKTLNLESSKIGSIIRRALRALAERPTLFQNCLDYIAEAREHNLTDAFYSVSTGSSMDRHQEPTAKPIDFYAHDPLRYVSDMLAWTHSAAVSEREALETLFISSGDEIARGIQAGKESDPWSEFDADAFDGRKVLDQLVNKNLAGVARALRQRIGQTIQNHEEPALIYQLANLLNFYYVTFLKFLGSDSIMIETLSSLEATAIRQFRGVMEDTVASTQADVNLPPSDLGVPGFLSEAFVLLETLLKSFDSTLTPSSSREATFEPIINISLAPYLSICQNLASAVDEPDQSIFFINCLLASKTLLSPFDFVPAQLSSLSSSLESSTASLTSYQHAFFLHTSGLHPLVSALAPFSSPSPHSPPNEKPSTPRLLTIYSLPAFRPAALKATSQTLDTFLPSAFIDAMENLKQLNSAKLAQEITAEAAERFCQDFEFVEGMLKDVDEVRAAEGTDESEEGEPWESTLAMRSLFPRTGAEIRVLLS